MEIDFSEVCLPDYLKSESTGWLEPDGTFHQCEYTEHLQAAYELYNTHDTEMLARHGIVHVFWNPVKSCTDYYAAIPLTNAQISWLENKDIKIYDEDINAV